MLVFQQHEPLPHRPHATRAESISKPLTTISDPFVFVPISGSEAATGRGAAKRIVRAHVTRVQHERNGNFNIGQDLQSWTVKPYQPSAANTKKKRTTKRAVETLKRNESSSDSSSSSSVITKRSSSSLSLPSGGAFDDPFWTFPVDRQPELSPIFAHYIQNVAVEIADIDGPSAKGLLRRVWFPMCMTSAAAMYAVLLMAASHYCIMNPHQASRIDLLALKARALSEINVELRKPDVSINDGVVGAVAKMAAYEAIFGDSDTFSAHMRGLQMMLKVRGGLSTLGLNGLLERMVVWIDLNACHLTGKAVHFGNEDYPTIVSFAAPDPYHFAGIQ